MEKKSALYICTGCGIGDALDIDKLEQLAKDNFSIPICRKHANLCSKEGVELIKKDMADEGVNTMAIAACSPRVMYDVFDFQGVVQKAAGVDVGLKVRDVFHQSPQAARAEGQRRWRGA